MHLNDIIADCNGQWGSDEIYLDLDEGSNVEISNEARSFVSLGLINAIKEITEYHGSRAKILTSSDENYLTIQILYDRPDLNDYKIKQLNQIYKGEETPPKELKKSSYLGNCCRILNATVVAEHCTELPYTFKNKITFPKENLTH